MKGKEVLELVGNGLELTVQFNKDIEFWEETFDTGMMAKIIRAQKLDNELVELIFDMTDFLDYNEPFEIPNWYDENGVSRLKWRESKSFPKDGIVKLVVDLENDVPFDVIKNFWLYDEYKTSKSMLRYTTWLEYRVMELQKKIEEK